MRVLWRLMTGLSLHSQPFRVHVKCTPPVPYFRAADKLSRHLHSLSSCTPRNVPPACSAERLDTPMRADSRRSVPQPSQLDADFQDQSKPSYYYFATCAPGLEDLVAAELSSPLIGARDVEVGSSGVGFSGPLATGYRANLWLRCAVRVLVQLSSANLNTTQAAGDSIYAFIRNSVHWHDLIDPRPESIPHSTSYSGSGSGSSSASNSTRDLSPRKSLNSGPNKSRTFSVESRVWDCSTISSTQLASTRAKDAICDALRDAYNGAKPEPPAPGECPELPLYLSLYRDRALLYRDMSGVSLHKRGYRDVMHKASLNEGVAAAVLKLAGWGQVGGGRVGEEGGEGSAKVLARVLCDPMCGSGTLLIEAALMARNQAPGLMRERWPFETWPDHNSTDWSKAVQEADALKSDSMPPGVRLLGNDIHPGALSLCERDAKSAGVYEWLELSCKNCADYTLPVSPSFVTVNPPWGSRLGDTRGEEGEWLIDTWQTLGLFLKRECSNADVTVLSGNASVTRELRMKADRKRPVTVGGIDCRVMHYKVLPPKPKDFSAGTLIENMDSKEKGVKVEDVESEKINLARTIEKEGPRQEPALSRKYNFPKRTTKY